MIEIVTKEQAEKIIKSGEPRGVFILHEPDDTYTAIDTKRDYLLAWTENFQTKEEAESWLELGDG